MKIIIAVATANATLLTYLSANRDNAVPPEIASHKYFCNRGARFSVQLQVLKHNTTEDDLGVWLRRLANDADGLVMLIDEPYRPVAKCFEDAYFVASLPDYPGYVAQNQARSALSPVLRHFIAYSQRFDDKKNLRVFLLPFDIFISQELSDLRERLTAGKMKGGLAEDIERLVALVNQRRKPKTKHGRSKNVYFTDDRTLFYEYGKERHAKVETCVSQHQEKCWHLSRFRFGRLYDDGLHHNVDDGGDPSSVKGNFTTCHGDVFVANGQSHLNIFPNGFI